MYEGLHMIKISIRVAREDLRPNTHWVSDTSSWRHSFDKARC